MQISILITTFNAEKYIFHTLNSIKNQTYSNFEIIIVDDGSTDNTINIVKQYISDNSLLPITFHPYKHIGRSRALLSAVNHARYDWVAIIDADDLWHTNKLELQVAYIQKYHLSFLATASQFFFEIDNIDIHNAIPNNISDKYLLKINLNNLLAYNKICHSSVIMRKKLAQYDANRQYQIDYALWFHLLTKNNALHIVNLTLTYHRIHASQSFEGKKSLTYSLSATLLQLKYCILNYKLFLSFFVIIKFFYYLLPRQCRLTLRNIFHRTKTQLRAKN